MKGIVCTQHFSGQANSYVYDIFNVPFPPCHYCDSFFSKQKCQVQRMKRQGNPNCISPSIKFLFMGNFNLLSVEGM